MNVANIAVAALAALIAALSSAAQADGANGRFWHDVAPGKIAEECRRVESGASIAYAFEATAPVDFNIHYHAGKDVRFPEQQDAIRQVAATFTAGATEDYCWMWTNRSASPVRVTGRLDPLGP